MSGVLDDQSSICNTSEVDSQLDLSNVRNLDCILWVAAKRALPVAGVIGGHAGPSFEDRLHDGNRVALVEVQACQVANDVRTRTSSFLPI